MQSQQISALNYRSPALNTGSNPFLLSSVAVGGAGGRCPGPDDPRREALNQTIFEIIGQNSIFASEARAGRTEYIRENRGTLKNAIDNFVENFKDFDDCPDGDSEKRFYSLLKDIQKNHDKMMDGLLKYAETLSGIGESVINSGSNLLKTILILIGLGSLANDLSPWMR
jgi:hypothetical protein